MEFGLVNFLKSVLLPPASLVLLAFVAAIFIRVKPYWSIRILVVSISLLYLCSIPAIVYPLAGLAEAAPLKPELIEELNADAIVILSASRIKDSPEYAGDVPNAVTLQRARYGAWLYKKTNYPIIISGGVMSEKYKTSESHLIGNLLQQDYNVPVEALEQTSRTTYENALYTSELLQSKGYNHILLVSHALHLPRAKQAFEAFDIQVTSAPTVFYAGHKIAFFKQILPNTKALRASSYLFHELIGRIWYQLRY